MLPHRGRGEASVPACNGYHPVCLTAVKFQEEEQRVHGRLPGCGPGLRRPGWESMCGLTPDAVASWMVRTLLPSGFAAKAPWMRSAVGHPQTFAAW
eukprot:616854-Lingulodinium_polyedra.AAC.1